MADWSILLGFLIYLVAIIFEIIYYLRYKKWFLVVYAASVSTYVFSVFYAWDVFELEGFAVLALLGVSILVMIYLGKHFSNIKLVKDKVHTTLKEK